MRCLPMSRSCDASQEDEQAPGVRTVSLGQLRGVGHAVGHHDYVWIEVV